MPLLKEHKTVRQAIRYVEQYPLWPSNSFQDRIDMPVWEAMTRHLFDIANYPDMKKRGGLNKALRAQRVLLNRSAGTRRRGSNPAVRKGAPVVLVDLTKTEQIGD